MADLIPFKFNIEPMSETGIGRARSLEAMNAARPQVPIEIDHTFYAGVYMRTAYVPKDTLITGALIKIPTIVTIHGEGMIYVGEDEPMHVAGRTEIMAAAGRKQAFVAVSDLVITMVFATSAKTVEEAEAEFTDEVELLTSRRETA